MNAPTAKKGESRRAWLGLIGWLLACFSAAALGGMFPPDEWFVQLRKPSWQPPNWIFAPVWSLLYTLMSLSVWHVWKKAGWNRSVFLFLIQLLLNALWTPLFFGLHRPLLALLDLMLLCLALVGTIWGFGRTSRLAALLLVPYLAWITFAAALNFTLWRMNI